MTKRLRKVKRESKYHLFAFSKFKFMFSVKLRLSIAYCMICELVRKNQLSFPIIIELTSIEFDLIFLPHQENNECIIKQMIIMNNE